MRFRRNETVEIEWGANVAMVLAEIHISHPDLTLVPTIRERSDVLIRREFQPVRSGSKLLLFFSVEGDDLDGFEEALDADPTVTGFRLIADYGTQRIFRVRVSDAAKSVTPMLAELGIQILNVQSDTEGWELQLQLPDNDALVAFRAYCRDEGVSFHVGTLYVETDGGGQTNFGLTGRQHDVLKMAYERGYFDDPRGVTLQELAASTGISSTALGRRLRRGMKRLVEKLLDL
ncbi:helix-turn-helix domain-containing protein [Haladaptatus sp. AB618]|uniref:helix-turn-helix domain-containing protein n=1 Tax=Haladaptatus sp. AB618 TaxID=2934173 RepID=UPI00209BC203|nr:helix-turn-helix domain-containing protein [Haladaptatus sp. AB618]MCO8255324.1 helix-turn-helix domain-containing protein [Haladaptatus sp. AB618]